MPATDIYDAARKIDQTLRGLPSWQIKTSLLMVLVALDEPDLLVDPKRFCMQASRVPLSNEPDSE